MSLMKSLIAATSLLALSAGGATAADKTLYVGMNGGTMEKTYTEKVFPLFEKETGVKVVVVPGTSTDILAKMQAQKEAPQMHIAFLDDGLMFRAIGMDLCERLQPSDAYRQLYPVAQIKGGMAAGVNMGMVGLAYNKKMFAENKWAPPSSWLDMTDPKFKGKLVVQSAPSSSFGLHAFLMFNRTQGGTESDVEPGFKTWKSKVGTNVLEYIPSSSKISEMVQTGEAALFPLTPTGVGALKEKGVDVEYAQPKEGSVVLMVGECAIKNNSEPELTQKLAAFLLSVPAQEAALQYGSQIPSNRQAKATPDKQAELETFQANMASATLVNWDVINEKRPEWNDRWNREIER